MSLIDAKSSGEKIFVENRLTRVVATTGPPKVLLIGPYDPHCGEYTFLAPPLGVWRLAGVLQSAGVEATVFDPATGAFSVYHPLVVNQGNTTFSLGVGNLLGRGSRLGDMRTRT